MDLRARRYIAAEVRAELARQGKWSNYVAEVLSITKFGASKKLHAHRSFRSDELVTLAHHLGVPVTNFLPAPAGVAS